LKGPPSSNKSETLSSQRQQQTNVVTPVRDLVGQEGSRPEGLWRGPDTITPTNRKAPKKTPRPARGLCKEKGRNRKFGIERKRERKKKVDLDAGKNGRRFRLAQGWGKLTEKEGTRKRG